MTGYDEIMGVSDVDILGDPAAAVAAATDEDVTRYAQEGWRASDRIFFGIVANATLAAGATATYSNQVSNPFKPLRWTIPSDQAPGLLLTSIKIGSIELIDGAGVEAQTFSEVSRNNQVSFPTAQTSQNISVTVVNNNAVARQVYISCYGPRLRK
ncbi:MAG: hypothetical protein JSV86_18435 [Gemmatimonadota bacterium]|nr:MAG: hypothetical protein JSV86_18435 [Gemmatimonadota bacterium]